MEAKKLAALCRDLAENRKAEDVAILDVRGLSSITDYFVICSGGNEPHLRAIAEELTSRLAKEDGVDLRAKDGSLASGWLVIDLFDVMVHIMHTEARSRYDLETLWGDAPRVKVKKARKKAAAKS
ncbi:MAG: ribosome silencing factor [Verrucomicrobia bacterium]|nr:ribosome silencing factor [Verrucomicrobiota bacterium]MBI3869660.1 ribosome silencing factor [Verrucomicrobiota bacterium]